MRRIMLGIVACLLLVVHATPARAQTPADDLVAKIDAIEAWLASGPYQEGWNSYLGLRELRQQVAAEKPDVAVVARTLSRLRSDQPSLERKKFADLRQSLERWIVANESYNQELPGFVRAAQFAPPSADEVNSRKAALASAVDQLDAYLARFSTGAGWRSYLDLEALKAELAKPEPDVSVLSATLEKLESGHRGLEAPRFREVDTALARYLRVLRATLTQNIQEDYKARVDALAGALDQQIAGGLKDFSPVLDTTSWLKSVGQNPDVVRAVESRFPFKNLFVTVSDDVIQSGYAQQQTDVKNINETVEGTRVRGTATTNGVLSVKLVPSDREAVWDAEFVGETISNTTGRNRSAVIGLHGQTSLYGTKRVILRPNGVSSLPATATASTDLDTTCIGATVGGIRGKIVRGIASNRVGDSLPGAERDTSRRAENELRVRLDERAGAQLADADRQFWERFRQPLAAKGLFPNDLKFQTTPNYLFASGTFTGPARIGAPTLPPGWAGATDLGVVAHETAVNSMAQAFLAGETFESENVRGEMGDMLGNLPDRFAQDEEGEPWSITFAERDPVTVAMRDDGLSITVRGERYTSGDRAYRAMNVTAHYKFQQTPKGIEAVRQGELEIFPPGFVPGERRLSVAEQTLRRMLERRMGKIFAPELGISEVTLPRNFAKAGPLVATQLNSSDGWLVAGWRQKSELASETRVAQAD